MIQNTLGILRTTRYSNFFIALSASISGLIIGGQKAWEFWGTAWGKIILFFLNVEVECMPRWNPQSVPCRFHHEP